jgi:hypothetical protein
MIVTKALPQKLLPRFCPAVHFVKAVTSAFGTKLTCPSSRCMSGKLDIATNRSDAHAHFLGSGP